MSPGDLIQDSDWAVEGFDNITKSTGIILRVLNNVDVSPMFEIMWDTGVISRVFKLDIELVNACPG